MSYLASLAKALGYFITFATFFTVVMLPIRKFVVKWLKKSLGIDEINEKLDFQAKKDIEKKTRAEERDKVMYEIKETLDNHIEKYNKELSTSRKIDVFSLRQSINDIYHKYVLLGYIPERVKKDLLDAWELYGSIHGNSYAEEEVEELLKLPVKL